MKALFRISPRSTVEPTIGNLTRAYVVALSAIAVLVVVGQVLVQVTLTTQKSDARTINIAGRQRMLSQRLMKAALQLDGSGEPSEVDRLRQEIKEALELWKKSDKGLRMGDEEQGLRAIESPAIVALFDTLDPSFRNMLDACDALLEASDGEADRSARVSDSVGRLQRSEATFLRGMDAIVFQYDSEARAKVLVLQQLELFLAVLTLFVLFGEGWFVFRPTVAKAREGFDGLAEARREIVRNHDHLVVVNAELDQALRKALDGILPICANCKSIRNDSGNWKRIETYISEHTNVAFSHGICPDCAEELYPGLLGDDCPSDGE